MVTNHRESTKSRTKCLLKSQSAIHQTPAYRNNRKRRFPNVIDLGTCEIFIDMFGTVLLLWQVIYLPYSDTIVFTIINLSYLLIVNDACLFVYRDLNPVVSINKNKSAKPRHA